MPDGEILGPDEFVLRRVHKNELRQNHPKPFRRSAFAPNKNDTDGLSFYRETETSAQAVKESARKPADEYVVIRIQVRQLNDVGLTVVTTDDPSGPFGHCVTPELNWVTYNDRSQKQRWTELQLKLIEPLEANDIVG
jgi:hypothetical protein